MASGLLKAAKNSKINPLNEKVLAKCAGYIIEGWIKYVIQMDMWRPGELNEPDKKKVINMGMININYQRFLKMVKLGMILHFVEINLK